MNAVQRKSLATAECDVALDNLTRQLYATDASIYQIEPLAVAFPGSATQASSVIRAAADASIAITPRGAGSGLAGGAIGDGLIVDFSQHNRGISDVDLEQRTVRVGVGVVLDQLNAFLKPHSFCFGPDVAASFSNALWRTFWVANRKRCASNKAAATLRFTRIATRSRL